MAGSVIAVARDGEHRFSKLPVPEIRLVEALGVEGDAHQGRRVKHRSRVAADPSQPNLRQVHLIHAELFKELLAQGFDIQPADLGENITTEGIDLLSLPKGTLLRIGDGIELEITGSAIPAPRSTPSVRAS